MGRPRAPTLDELEAIIGYAATRRLVLRYGGGRVSARHDRDSELALVLRDAYEPFCRHYAGEWVPVPLDLDDRRLRLDLPAHILRDIEAGLTLDEIAPRYAIGRSTLCRLIARSRRAGAA